MESTAPAAHADTTGAAESHARPFRLTRYFSMASLVGIAVVMACLVWTYRELTLQHLIEHESRSNADLTRSFANSFWETYRPFVMNSRGLSREQLLKDPVQKRLREEVLRQIAGMNIAKIKIYNIDGLTVFSTDERQVGENKRSNDGFRQAHGGAVVSAITYRDKFDAFEGTRTNHNLIYSYIPVHAGPQGTVEGVFEVYSDVTTLLDRQRQAQWQVAGVVLGMLAALYLFLHLVVRKADRIIIDQERERSKREAEIRHLAHHDALTGLANRAYFGERLNESLSYVKRYGNNGALMYIDLDRFKSVNDTLGHKAGDMLLQIVADRMRSCLRNTDLLFRMGGDEFTIISPGLVTPEDAAHLARRIILSVSAPVSLYEHEIHVGASIGIAVFPSDGDEPDQLVKNADAAMYNAKQAGRGRHAFYRPVMDERSLQPSVL